MPNDGEILQGGGDFIERPSFYRKVSIVKSLFFGSRQVIKDE